MTETFWGIKNYFINFNQWKHQFCCSGLQALTNTDFWVFATNSRTPTVNCRILEPKLNVEKCLFSYNAEQTAWNTFPKLTSKPTYTRSFLWFASTFCQNWIFSSVLTLFSTLVPTSDEDTTNNLSQATNRGPNFIKPVLKFTYPDINLPIFSTQHTKWENHDAKRKNILNTSVFVRFHLFWNRKRWRQHA